MNSKNPIGIFDSGIGGLTIAAAISDLLPNEQLIYFGDTKHLPYGNKKNKEIQFYSEKITDFLLQKKCKAVVMACNSASSIAFKNVLKQTKNKSLLFNVIDPVVDYVIENNAIKNLGVIGTNVTISSNAYEKKIQTYRKDINICSLSTPLLASLIEDDNKRGYQNELRIYLENKILIGVDSLILGCTHYPLIETEINDFYNSQVNIISSLTHVAQNIKKTLRKNNLLNITHNKNQHQFYVSNYTEKFQKKTELFFSSSIILQEENIF